MKNQQELRPTGKNEVEAYVCISYKSEDQKTVFEDCIYPIMRDYGLKVYWDEAFRNNASRAWNAQMLDNIEEAKAVLLFVSNKYIGSYACFLEALFSFVYEKDVIIIRLDSELKVSSDAVERKVSDNTINEFANLLKEFEKDDVQKRLPMGINRFVINLVKNKSVSPKEISTRFLALIRKFEVTQLDIKSFPAGLSSLETSLKNVNKEVFGEVSKQQEIITEPETTPAPSVSSANDTKPGKVKTVTNVKPGDDTKLKISCNSTLAEIREAFSDPGIAAGFKQVRESMPWGGKSAMDYVMASVLGGCNNVNASSPQYQINYYLYVVSNGKEKDKGLGATWTWSSNCRKALGLEDSGAIPEEYNLYFKMMPEDTKLDRIGTLFIKESAKQFDTVKEPHIVIALNLLSDFMAQPKREVVKSEEKPAPKPAGDAAVAGGNIESKEDAVEFLLSKGITVGAALTYASFNDMRKCYWANPKVERVKEDWDIVLNNKNSGKVTVIRIPANTFVLSDEPGKGLMSRKDKTSVIDLLISDGDYVDKKSKIDLSPYVIGEYSYSGTAAASGTAAKPKTEPKTESKAESKAVSGGLLRYLDALAIEHDGVITVLKNSGIRMKTAPSCPNKAKQERENAIATGKMKEKRGQYVLQEDITFPSRSAAASFVAGLSVSGNKSWE